MKKTPVDHKGEQEKVVSLQLDAGFYFDRAIRSLECHRYDKALKYFRFSIEKEPENPVNYCNLAGLLAELGRFEESNHVLETVLDEVDPDLHECLYFIANNYAHMECFEVAESYLLDYLSRESESEYVEEAEEMLDLLSYELGRPPRELPHALPPYMQKHEQARFYLQDGKFKQAIELLEEIIELEPTFLAAYNNLSLAYFYQGQMEQAMRMIEVVLDTEPTNLHALCNLAIFTYQEQELDICSNLIQQLKKLIPLHQDHLYKLATTLGILGEHDTAFRLFYRLLKSGMGPDASLYHCLAVAACNSGRLAKAAYYWKKAASLDPDSQVPAFYLTQVEKWMNQPDQEVFGIHYHYHLPFEETLLQLQLNKQDLQALAKTPIDPLLFDSFRWVLDQGDQAAKVKVIQLLGIIGDETCESLLRNYLLKRTHEEECKKLALLVLYQTQAALPYTVWIYDQLHIIQLPDDQRTETAVDQTWNQILARCLEGMKHYSAKQQEDVRRLWSAFIEKQGAQLPNVRRIEAWAAAFEYVIAKYHGLHITQSQVANKYAVSPSIVSHHVKKLNPLQMRVQKGGHKERRRSRND